MSIRAVLVPVPRITLFFIGSELRLLLTEPPARG